MIVNDLFLYDTENHYDLRHHRDFKIPFVDSVYHSSESISYFSAKIWNIVRPEAKQSNSLNGFKKSIRKWIPADGPGRLCITFNLCKDCLLTNHVCLFEGSFWN